MGALAKTRNDESWLMEAKQNLTSLKGSADKAFATYELVMFPEGDTGKEVSLFTQKLQQIFSGELLIYDKAFIGLGSFLGREEMEETLIRWIQRICNSECRFVVTVNNFGCLPPDLLYLRILDQQPFLRLIKKLMVIDNYIFSNGYGEVEWSSRPVCKLACQIQPDFDHSKIRSYANLEFHAEFLAYNVVLLKTMPQDRIRAVVNVFPLYPK